eukprot:CAMPEP_0170750964 /NCGR_PEP_ID=MMETSP0437-20130122/11204_1 /TAXON_ID=0 /ORGANISM="Sexangularia sp." /LENGTH=417 /DNA_ID=CAMNT_0011089979 /DNA_START=133 /DNA_END=1386 /DNA_ORIENTATION=-
MNSSGFFWRGSGGSALLGVNPLFAPRYIALFSFLATTQELQGHEEYRASVALGDHGLSHLRRQLGRPGAEPLPTPPCLLVQTMPRGWARSDHPGRRWVVPILVHGPEVLPPFARPEDEWRTLLAKRRRRWQAADWASSRQRRSLLWRGNPHFYEANASRPRLVAASTACYAQFGDECPIDAAFAPLPSWLRPEQARAMRATYRVAPAYLDFSRFAEAALVGDVAGYAWSARLPRLLASASLVVRVGNEHLSRAGWRDAGGVGPHEVVELGFDGQHWTDHDLRVVVDQWTGQEAWEARWRRIAAAHEWVAHTLSTAAVTASWLADLRTATDGKTCKGFVPVEETNSSAVWYRFVPCSVATDARSCAAHRLGLGVCTFVDRRQECVWDPHKSAKAAGLKDVTRYTHEGTVMHSADVVGG